MDAGQRLREGLERLDLIVDEARQKSLLAYLEELQRWGRSINLTAIRDVDEGVEKHLLDALTLLPLLRGDELLLDIGSGAGLPGIPLKIVLPELELVSVEAAEKKALFQKHVLRLLGLDARVEHSRVETLGKEAYGGAGFEVVTARAFSSLGKLLELSEPLLRKGGRVIAMKGPEGEGEWRQVKDSSNGWCCRQFVECVLPFSHAQRQLLVLERRC